jgi:HEAT repeat protein
MFRRTSLLLGALVVGLGLVVGSTASLGQTAAEVDEQILKSLKLPTDTEGLLQFFRARIVKDEDQKRVQELAKQLDSTSLAQRNKAFAELIAVGPASLPHLRELVKSGSIEAVRRAEDCIKSIEATTKSDTFAVASRVLAQRQVAAAAPLLFDFLPVLDDPWQEEEVLTSLGRLTVRPGHADPLILKAMKDPSPQRKAVAVYLLGRRGDPEHREALRALLNDPDPALQLRVRQGLVGKRTAQGFHDHYASDEAILKKNNIEVAEETMLNLLRKRTLSDKDQQRMRQLVRDLGSPAFRVRDTASKALIKEGSTSLAFLRDSDIGDVDFETSRRAQRCVEEIRRGPGTSLPLAAIRLVTREITEKKKSPTEPIQVLLAYVPFADDDMVEDEVLNALTLLSMREPKIDPVLVSALADALPARRGAAAFVLGQVGLLEHVKQLPKLLDDPSINVRLRAVQGLLATREKSAVGKLIAMITQVPATSRWRVEEMLQRVAGDQTPADSQFNSSDGIEKTAKAWEKWWQASAEKYDIARYSEGGNYLGLFTISEYDNQMGRVGGKVWETTRSTTPRWQISGEVIGVMDAHMLPNGNVLVCESGANRVTERTPDGKKVWEFLPRNNSPITAQRLANGNTFVATYNEVMEIRPDQSIVYRLQPGPQFYIFSAQKTRKGTIVAITAQGQIIELDPKTGKQNPPIATGSNGNWCSVELLPNGNYLVATMANNRVRELDPQGQEVWGFTYQGVFRATRLPTGNFLVTSMTSRRVAEVDRTGAERWHVVCQGRPWNARFR